MQAKKQQNQTWKNRLVQNWERSTVKAVCCHSAYLLLHAEYIMQNAGLDKSNWNQDCWEKYQQPQTCKYTTLMSKQRATKKPLKCERVKKVKTFKKERSWHLVLSLNGKHKGKKWKLTDFIFLGSIITVDSDCSSDVKRHSLEEKL